MAAILAPAARISQATGIGNSIPIIDAEA